MHERTSSFLRRAGWLLPSAALSMLGCPKQELAPLGPCTVSAVSERVDQIGISDVDLLFVIDNSGSMASEQVKLAEELPRLVGVLTSGNKNYPNPAANADDTFTPVSSLHLGVVSTNMGGIDTIQGEPGAGVRSCQGLGDDGVLQNSTQIAREGVRATTGEFDGYAAGETVIAPDATCSDAIQPVYQDYVAGMEPSAEEIGDSFRCVSRLGVRGCPFEQQLEAMWKALAPSGTDALHTFLNGTKGQGDRENKNFLRSNAILAVLHVSDEEDCSITEDGKDLLLNLNNNAHFGPLNLRCGLHSDPEEGLLYPVERYVDGLKSLKPENPDRIIFGAIVGIPTDAEGDSLQDILNRPEMEFAPDPQKTTFPRRSCFRQEPGGKLNEAYPPRRFLEVAKGFGTQAVIYSICEDNYAPALDLLIDRIANQLSGNCLPRQLNRSDEGLVNCEVYELLTEGETTCSENRGHIDDQPVNRTVRTSTGTETRPACKMAQVPVSNRMAGSGFGWYYDDFSSDLENCKAGEQQRISFKFSNGGDLPSGAGAIFECFQPVARIDANAKGFDAVNTRCIDDSGATDQGPCQEKSNGGERGGYDLICIEQLNTCQIACDVDPDCPPGWVCASALEGTADGPTFCQLPTCPQVVPSGG